MQKKNMMQNKIIQKLSFFLMSLIVWQLVYFIGVDVLEVWKSYAIPSPKGVFSRMISLFGSASIYLAIVASMKRVLWGYTISIILGGSLGLLLSKFTYLRQNLKPVILGLQTLPSICWVPFAILWYGLNETSVIFVIVMGSMFSIAMTVDNGIQNVEPLYLRVAKTMGATQKELYLKVIFPAMLPVFVSGLKQGWSFAWRALIAGEMMISMIGLGQVLDSARNIRNDINEVMLVMILMICIGTIFDRCIFQVIEARVRKNRGLDRDKN